MDRKTAKTIRLLLTGCLMLGIPAVVYLEIHSYIGIGMILVCAMFALAMGMLWVSEAEDRQEQPGKTGAASGKRQMRRQG